MRFKFGLHPQNDSFYLMTDTSRLINNEKPFVISFTLVRVVFFLLSLLYTYLKSSDFRRCHLIDSYLCLVIFGLGLTEKEIRSFALRRSIGNP